MAREADGGRVAPMARATVRLRCRSPEEARILWDSVRADDPGSVEGRVEGDLLVITAGPDPMPSLRVTLDDLLACLQAASGATDATADIGEVE
jgi:hypothetical protein